MNYYEEYKQKLTTPEEAVKVVKSGDWVDYGAYMGFPTLLDEALAARKDELENVNVRGLLFDDPIQIVEQDLERDVFTYNSWHMLNFERKLSDRGLCNFIPMLFRNLPMYYERELDVNVAMFAVPPMDKNGYFNFSVNNCNARAVLEKADIVILEVNENLPVILGLENNIHISDVDMVVEGPHKPLKDYPSAKATEVDAIIADMVIAQIEDGACIQLGVGGMPNLIGKKLAESDLKDLGCHSELLVNAYLDMHKAGKLTNKNKSGMFKGTSVFGIVHGDSELREWATMNPGLCSLAMDKVNSVRTISEIDKFTSINSAISVDLYGQIAAEAAGTRHISGTGGQLDFLTGAYDNPTGKAFICLPSSRVDKQGVRHSNIKPIFNGDIVTDPRSQGYYIATEYGMINLAGRTTWERAEKLISIAHPDFREDLIQNAEAMKIWKRSNKR